MTQPLWLVYKGIINSTTYRPHCKDIYQKFETSIPRKGIARPQSPFMSLSTIYKFARLVCLFCSCRKIGGPILGIYRSLTDTCGKWDFHRAIPFLGIHKSKFLCSAYRSGWTVPLTSGRCTLYIRIQKLDVDVWNYQIICNSGHVAGSLHIVMWYMSVRNSVLGVNISLYNSKRSANVLANAYKDIVQYIAICLQHAKTRQEKQS